MRPLVALDLAVGPALVEQIRRARERDEAVCVLDQRDSAVVRRQVLELLAPTDIVTHEGRQSLLTGRPVEDGDGLVMLTSGSSGTPKAAVLTWRALEASAQLTTAALDRGASAQWFVSLPAVHIGGFAVLARSVLANARLQWDGDVASAPSLGATHVAVVRTQLFRHDLSAYDVVLLGGARPPEQLGPNVVTTWGMTETGSGVVYNGEALPGVDVATRDGELLVRSPTLLRTYRNQPAPMVQGPDGQSNWFATGDAGEVRGTSVHVLGRLQYVINTGGEKLWPENLEALFATATGVSDVAVAGKPDDEWGQRLVVYVVTTRDVSQVRDELRALATERIGPWAKPRDVRVVASIPRTSNGKVRRDQLGEAL